MRKSIFSLLKTGKFNLDNVPFVPALDLLEQKVNRLTPEEAAAVGLALSIQLNCEVLQTKSKWAFNSRQEALNQRL